MVEEFLSASALAMRPNAIRALTKYLHRPGLISFAGGYPSPETFPRAEIAEITARLLGEQGDSVLQYGATRGNQALREYLTESLPSLLGPVELDQILLTSGSQQGLDLAARTLVDPGDVVLVELPSYVGALACFAAAQAELVGVKQQEDGIDLEDLVNQIAAVKRAGKRAKLIYAIPNFQNPSGVTMSPFKRQRLVEIAAEHNLMILEDDPYGDLHFYEDSIDISQRPESLRPIYGFAADLGHHDRVVYAASFSKVLVPGLRTAYIVAHNVLARKLELAKEAADICSSMLDEAIVNVACRQDLINRRLPSIRRFYQKRCAAMLTVLGEHAPPSAHWVAPTGGLFVWVELASKVNATELLKDVIEQGVAFVPGESFFVNGTGANTLRLAFSKESPETITEGMKRLCQAL